MTSMPHHPCSDGGPSAAATSTQCLQHTTDGFQKLSFYFTVFFSNNPPLFHSNRIRAEVLGVTPSSPSPSPPLATTTPVVAAELSPEPSIGISNSGSTACFDCHRYWYRVFQHNNDGLGGSSDGAVGDTRGMTYGEEEVPQQTLQAVAFPTAFGLSGSRVMPPVPCRSPGTRTPRTSSAQSACSTASKPAIHHGNGPPARFQSTFPPVTLEETLPEYTSRAASSHQLQNGASHPFGGATESLNRPPISAAAKEGPPWNMRLEEIRSAKGELRYYRVILTSSFTALVTLHTGPLHTMQTRAAAVALVLMCPPSGVQYRYLLHHMDLLRSMLYRVTEFGIRTVQRFFQLFFSPRCRPRGTQLQVLRAIATQLEEHAEAVEVYHSLKAELANALHLSFPLPLLAVPSSEWVARLLSLSQKCPGPYAPLSKEGTLLESASELPAKTLSELLFEAVCILCEYNEGFTSALICGLLSLLGTGANDSGGSTNQGGRTATGAPLETALSSPVVGSPSLTPFDLPQQSSFADHANAVAAPVVSHRDPYAAYWASLETAELPDFLGAPRSASADFTNGAPLVATLPQFSPGTTVSALTPIVSPLTTELVSRSPPTGPLRNGGLPNTPTPTTTVPPSLTVTVPQPSSSPPAFPLNERASVHAAATSQQGPMQRKTRAEEEVEKEKDSYLLHRGRLGRVVIFTPDPQLGRRLLMLAAFLWVGAGSGEESALTAPRGGGSSSTAADLLMVAQRMYETAIAAGVTSCAYANVAIQWVMEEFSESRLSTIASRFSPDNTVLVVAPRQLLCRRVHLHKYVESMTVLVEQRQGKEVRIRSSAFPFHCSIASQTRLQADPKVTTLLREALSLHRCSGGTVAFADVFQRMVKWIYAETDTAFQRKEQQQQQQQEELIVSSTTGFSGPVRVVEGTSQGLSRNSSREAPLHSLASVISNSRISSPLAIGAGGFSVTFGSDDAAEEPVEAQLLPGSIAVPVSTAPPSILSRSAASSLLSTHGLLQPPSLFTSATPTTATANGSAGFPSPTRAPFSFLNAFRRSPNCHPLLSPTVRRQGEFGSGGSQLLRLLSEERREQI